MPVLFAPLLETPMFLVKFEQTGKKTCGRTLKNVFYESFENVYIYILAKCSSCNEKKAKSVRSDSRRSRNDKHDWRMLYVSLEAETNI